MLGAPMQFSIDDFEVDERSHLIEVAGQLDLYTAPEFKQRILGVIDQKKARVIVDLSRLTFMDSTGLGVLVTALKRLRTRAGTLALVLTDYDTERMLEITGLDGVFSIYRSREEALATRDVSGRGSRSQPGGGTSARVS